jgi:hypothetical protein
LQALVLKVSTVQGGGANAHLVEVAWPSLFHIMSMLAHCGALWPTGGPIKGWLNCARRNINTPCS